MSNGLIRALSVFGIIASGLFSVIIEIHQFDGFLVAFDVSESAEPFQTIRTFIVFLELFKFLSLGHIFLRKITQNEVELNAVLHFKDHVAQHHISKLPDFGEVILQIIKVFLLDLQERQVVHHCERQEHPEVVPQLQKGSEGRPFLQKLVDGQGGAQSI